MEILKLFFTTRIFSVSKYLNITFIENTVLGREKDMKTHITVS